MPFAFFFNRFCSRVICRLPEIFGNLPRLKHLELDLKFEEIPELLCHLSAWKHQALRGLKCLELPKSFGELCALQTLAIQSNSMAPVPKSIGCKLCIWRARVCAPFSKASDK
jgi:hypothetical protein